jgi:hypothetical protein
MLPDNVKVVYHAHAVDLSFAITTWKSQGGTYDYIIALLENARPPLSFELLYVMFSRVRQASRFRCMPLLDRDKTRKLLFKMRPKIDAVKWRMDVRNKDGKWQLPPSKTTTHKEKRLPKATVARHAQERARREQSSDMSPTKRELQHEEGNGNKRRRI